MTLSMQTAYLFLLAIPVACIAWTVTHEEVFREPRNYCKRYAERGSNLATRKFFYLFTCEYCFSHYVALLAIVVTRFRLLYPGLLGYVIAGFSLVWIANIYMAIFARIKLEIKKDRLEITEKESNGKGSKP